MSSLKEQVRRLTEENGQLQQRVRQLEEERDTAVAERDQSQEKTEELSGELYRLKGVEEECRVDHLTKVGNRRSCDETLDQVFANYIRHHRNFGIAMCDVRELKLLNDNFGHSVGDEALKLVAETFRFTSRVSDSAHRTGGDEFVLILPDCGSTGLRTVTDRIKRVLDKRPMETEEGPHVVGLRIASLYVNGEDQYDSAEDVYNAVDAILTRMTRQEGGR
jgi:diguanylate cyclase (GGDEF)-like protein